MENKNITLTNLTKGQRAWLRGEARKRALTITGFIKLLAEEGIKKAKQRR